MQATESNLMVRVAGAVGESFNQAPDGYFYPVEQGDPLVRVYVSKGGWVIERRARSHTVWLPIASGTLAEFDPGSFRHWRAHYSVVL